MWWLTLLVATTGASFVVERRAVAHGIIIVSSPVNNLKQCADSCLQTPACTGFNFIIKVTNTAHCILVDGSKQFAEREKPLAEAVLYSGKRIHVDSCGKKSFAFERWPNRTFKSVSSILEVVTDIQLSDCLKRCQKRENCLSVAFYQGGRCQLSAISPNTIYNTRQHFEFTEEADLYENNCRGNDISQFDGHCSWMRVKSAGLPSIWDTKDNLEDVDECERKCVLRDREGDPCRSYTFDSHTNTCFLSQVSARLSGKSPLEDTNSRYTHGDLDDCIDFSLHCQEDGLELRGRSVRQFSGYVRTKEGKQMICTKTVNSTFEYSVKMGIDECGFKLYEKPFPLFRGIVHVKDGSTPLITIRDKILNVECRLHSQMPMVDQFLAVEMQVEETNRTDVALSNKVLIVPSKAPSVPKYSINVLDFEGSPSDAIKYGEQGWVQVVMNQKEIATSFSVSKLEAHDMKNNQRVSLLNDEGCVSNGSIIKKIRRPAPQDIRFLINYEFFDQGAEIVFYAYAEPCSGNCDPPCNSEYFSSKNIITSSLVSMRTKRSITSTQIELSQDLYPLHSSRIQLFREESKNQYTEGKVEVTEVTEPSFEDNLTRCILHDSTCFFSFTLASIQFSLIVVCFIVMYCYYRQYRLYRVVTTPQTPHAAVEQTKY